MNLYSATTVVNPETGELLVESQARLLAREDRMDHWQVNIASFPAVFFTNRVVFFDDLPDPRKNGPYSEKYIWCKAVYRLVPSDVPNRAARVELVAIQLPGSTEYIENIEQQELPKPCFFLLREFDDYMCASTELWRSDDREGRNRTLISSRTSDGKTSVTFNDDSGATKRFRDILSRLEIPYSVHSEQPVNNWVLDALS